MDSNYGGGLARFNDTNWVVYNTGNSGIPNNVLRSVVTENNIKWVGAYNFNGGVGKFNDINWIVYNTSNSPLQSNLITGINLDRQNNKWFSTQFGGLAKFSSTLNNWTIYTSTNSGIGEDNLNNIAIDMNNVKYVCPFSVGLKVFNDTTWITYNIGNSPIPSNSIIYIAIDSNNNKWIGTAGGLAIFNQGGIIGINNNQNNLPVNFILYQNYPNPFNPTTNIKYQISKNSFISIKIFDVSGKEITSLINNRKNTGTYEINYDASGLSSGIYFYSLFINGEITETRKMALIK